MTDMLSITGLSKRYNDGQVALENVSFDVKEGEILALLGPNGAGKTTLISAVCGLVVPTAGQVTVGGFDTRLNYRLARSLIGLVPQEIALEPFEKVIDFGEMTETSFKLTVSAILTQYPYAGIHAITIMCLYISFILGCLSQNNFCFLAVGLLTYPI